MTTGSMRRLLPAALVLSGASSLALEVAWSRSLSLVLGNSHQAVATVVTSMMAGLWAGSLVASRLLPRIERPAAAYGRIEITIGSYAALTPLIFKALPFVLAPFYEPGSPLFAGMRFALVFIVLLPASAGMGATLPLVTAALARSTEDPVGGRLYGLNTAGAFLGTLLAGFVLLPQLGLLTTTLVAASTAWGLGFLVWRLSLSTPSGVAAPSRTLPAAAPARFAWVLPIYAVSGALAMIYEVMWTRALVPIVGTSVYSFSLILAAVLAGISLGSLLLSSKVAARLDAARGFVIGQILLAVSAFLSVGMLARFPDLVEGIVAKYRFHPALFVLAEFTVLSAVVLLPAVFLGALFPLATRLSTRTAKQAGVAIGRVYAWNTAGSIAGSLAAGFVLVELLGTGRTLVVASATSALVALAALPLTTGNAFRATAGTLAATLALSFPLLFPTWDLRRMTHGITDILRTTERGAASRPTADSEVVFHREGKTATVTVLHERSEALLVVDGKTDASTTAADMKTQVLLGHAPFLFARQTKSACVIGLGSGVTSHAVLTHPVERLDTIEIERQVVEASAFFESVNDRPLDDPRSHLILDDARTALLYGSRTYDVIISEPSNPWIAGVNNLFTTEFYELVRRRLNPQGIFCQWVQFYEMSPESLLSVFAAVKAAFPHAHVLGSHMEGDLILLASVDPLEIVPGAVRLFPERPRVAPDLARVGMLTLGDLALQYTGPIALPADGVQANTNDNALLQYRTPFEMLRSTEPQLLGVERSPESVPGLFFPGVIERNVLRVLGRAALRRELEETAYAIAGHMANQGYAAEALELRGLLVDPQRQLESR